MAAVLEAPASAPLAAPASASTSATSAPARAPANSPARYMPSHIGGDATKLTAQQRELVEIAAKLGREKLAVRAAHYDKTATFPFENYADMREAGLLKICVPKAHGGLGADFATYVLTAAEMGRYCGATALSWNMHVSSAMWASFIADDLEMTAQERREHETHRAIHFENMVQHGKIYSQPFSEGGAAAAGKAPWGTLAKRVDGGYVVNGKKIFASLSGAADFYGVLCTVDKPGATQKDSLYLAVPATAEGVSLSGDWDPLGMRGTVSRTLHFKDVFVPTTARLMPEGMYAQAAQRWPHMFATLSPTYMGIAQAAYDFTVAYLRGEVEGTPPVKRRMYPTKQITVAHMRITLEQTRALFLQNARDARVDPDKDTRLRIYSAHYTIMENANELCRLAIRTCGGQSMLKTLPLERMYRDSRCGSLMLPWTAELCLDRLGRECLYEPGERDEVLE
jgi:alkylation response protein AidB-like acyl-CoA dehydrogenase